MTRAPDFDAVYRADPDPWQVRSSFYEQRKLAVVLACLGSATVRYAWDPASGTGELAARLACRAERVLATDGSEEAVQLTRRRCAGLTNVETAQLALPESPPAGTEVDLVVLSEFVYYLDENARRRTLDLVDQLAAEQAEVVSLHWRHEPHDAWLSGAAVQAEIAEHLRAQGWQQAVHHEDRDFVLDVASRDRR